MHLFENIKMALESIKNNRMRSFLTMLGIIIGIASVIMIVATGDGAKAKMMSSTEEVGATTLQVSLNTQQAETSDSITMEDVEAIRGLAGVTAVSPLGQGYGRVSFGRHEKFAIIMGSTHDFDQINAVELIQGRFFSAEDYAAARKVVVLDDISARKFFGTSDVIGMDVSMAVSDGTGSVTIKAKIVGVATSPYSAYGLDFDEMPGTLYIPFTTLDEALGGDSRVESLYVKTEREEVKETVSTNVQNLLEARHNARGRGSYIVQDLMQQVDMLNDLIGMIQTFVAAVAAISLLVGGVGVMNIMLVSVSERTREIGIRKALGAQTGAIMQQFLTESAILSLIGGIIGMTVGYVGSLAICSLVDVEPVFTLSSILFTICFSAGVGIFFGIYPAKKAAQMNPIEALRHE